MTLAAFPTPVDARAPLLLPDELQLTPDQFAAVCQANPNAVLELDAGGHLIHMTPTGSETGARNSSLLMPKRLSAMATPLIAVQTPGQQTMHFREQRQCVRG
jgi:hypothetical protein